MKYRIILSLILALAAMAADAKSALFSTFDGMVDIQTVYISKTMIDLGMSAAGDMDLSKLKGKLNSIEIITSDKAAGVKKLREARKSFAGHEELMAVTDGDERVKVYMKKGKNGVYEYILDAAEPGEQTYMVFSGTMTPQEIVAMVKH